jgi:GntR family transcriptional regulator
VFFNVNTSNGVPVYEQITRQIAFAIASGGIETGQLVPSVRNLSKELAVNPNTVARAYRQLQDHGVLESLRGEGLVVMKGAAAKCRATRKKIMSDRILAVLLEARQSQLTDEEIQSMVDEALASSKKKANKNRTNRKSQANE